MAPLRDELVRIRRELERLYASRDALDCTFTPGQHLHYDQLVRRERELLKALQMGLSADAAPASECPRLARAWRVVFRLRGAEPALHYADGHVQAWNFGADLVLNDEQGLLEELCVEENFEGTWRVHYVFPLRR
jgi:hypothetical protein